MNRQEKKDVEKRVMASKKLAYDIIVSALIVTLHDEFGFGEVRLDRLMKGIANQCDFMTKGMIGWMDYKEYAEEKTGMDLSDYYEEL